MIYQIQNFFKFSSKRTHLKFNKQNNTKISVFANQIILCNSSVKSSQMSRIVKPLKSASLIITRSKKSETSFFDYEILMMKRKARPPWGSVLVFPGGLYDAQHDNYLKQRFGFASSLQATAVRQCFQQAGLFFTQKPILQLQKINELSKIRLDYISNCLDEIDYKQISRNYIQKLGEVFTPKKNVLPFLRLITIPQLPSRYDTTFFLHKLDEFKYINFLKYSQNQKFLHESDEIVKCDNEFQKFRWMNPAQILSQFFSKQLSLAPPQYMMINTMFKFHKHSDIEQYLSESYQENDTFGNVSLGPNIVSLIPNKPTLQKPFKYAATMLGDAEFPYKRHIQNEVCPLLKQQIKTWQQNSSQFEQGKNRFLFNQSKQFFQDVYQVQCTLKRSNLRKMMGSAETKGRLQKQVVI